MKWGEVHEWRRHLQAQGLGPILSPGLGHFTSTLVASTVFICSSVSSPCSQPYVVCRQCPDYRRQAGQPLPGEQGPPQASGDTPSTSVSVATGEMATPSVLSLHCDHSGCSLHFRQLFALLLSTSSCVTTSHSSLLVTICFELMN